MLESIDVSGRKMSLKPFNKIATDVKCQYRILKNKNSLISANNTSYILQNHNNIRKKSIGKIKFL